MNEALGLIEIKGLSAAINILDTMLKVASVELIDVEKTKGSGWMTIKVSGNVGAVNASVEAGTAKAKESNVLVASKVIPRPMEDIVSKFLHKEEIQDEKLDINRNNSHETSKSEATQEELAVSEIKTAQINGVESNEKSAGSTENSSLEKGQVNSPKVQDEKNLTVDSNVKAGNTTALQNQDTLVTDSSKKASEKDLKSVGTISKGPTQKKATRTNRTTNSEEKKTSSSNNK